MSLTQKVDFETRLQRGNRVQVPKFVRWRFKLECDQILKVTVSVFDGWGVSRSFLSRMGRDGRIVVPRLMLDLLRGDELSLEGWVMEVTLEPS